MMIRGPTNVVLYSRLELGENLMSITATMATAFDPVTAGTLRV